MKYINIVFIFAALSMVDAQVTEEWARRYSGPGSGTDRSNAVVADPAGNVYITGSSMSGGSGTEDYVTIKYNSAGTLQWLHRYDGTGGLTDIAYAIAIDAAGSVYVTGASSGSGSNYDYLTIKYSTAGDTLWTRRYNGPRNGNDIAYSIAIDDSANIYITGESEGSTGTHGIFEDYATIKYDSAGTLRWSARYNGPAGDYDRANSVAVDTSGNVYVTGTSDGGSSGSGQPHFDYATVKYNGAGVVQWVRRYNAANSDDEAKTVKVDPTGNVYVTGYSFGSTDYDYATIKYTAAGDTLWARTYNGPADNTDKTNDLVIDDLGNVYVTGSSYGGLGTNYDYATVKYNSAGDTLWVNRYNGPDSSSDQGASIALDKLHNVYVTGKSTAASTGFDYATVKYDESGAEKWIIRYSNSGAAGSSDEPSSIYVDTLSNVYVTGMSALDYATVKYSQSVTGIGQRPQDLPQNYSLSQNYPNPFNPGTTIEFSLPSPEFVTLSIFNVLGEKISVLLSEHVSAGAHHVEWNAQALPSGIYLYRLQAGVFGETKKLILLR